MKYRLKVYSIWEYGQRKDAEGNPHQEDCTFPLPKDLSDSDRTFILCDGMGGHDAGEVASATVCETMGNYILGDGHDAEGEFTDEDLKNAIAVAFSALDKKDNGAEKKMGTTMTFLKLHNNGATIAHMGDSRVYQIRPGANGEDTRILFETEDHSLVNDLVKIGELTTEEARTSKQKNVITRAMQPNMERKPKADIKHITDIKAGDFFYMCSDGMLEQEDMANGESLKNIFSNTVATVDEKILILTGATKHNRDNHTALIIHIEDVEGAIAEEEENTAAVPQYDMALVEDDSSDGTPASGEDTANAGAKASGEDTANAGAKTDSGNTDEDTTQSALPGSKTGVSRLITGGISAAIIVAACIVGINYIPSCSGERTQEKTEIGTKEDRPTGRQERREREKKEDSQPQSQPQQQPQSQPQAQPQAESQQELSEAVAIQAANSGAAQIATGENPQRPDSSGSNPAPIQLPEPEGVVGSDFQKIQQTVK